MVIEDELHLILEKPGKRLGNLGEILDKSSIKSSMAQKTSYSLLVSREGQFGYYIHLSLIHLDTLF